MPTSKTTRSTKPPKAGAPADPDTTESVSTELLSPIEVAATLGIKPKTLKNWRSQRIGPPPTYIGSKVVMYAREDVEDWVATVRARSHQEWMAS